MMKSLEIMEGTCGDATVCMEKARSQPLVLGFLPFKQHRRHQLRSHHNLSWTPRQQALPSTASTFIDSRSQVSRPYLLQTVAS